MKTLALFCCVLTLFWRMTLTYKIPCPRECSACYRNNTGDLVRVRCTDIVIPSLPVTIRQIQVYDAVSEKTLPLGQLKKFIFTKRTALESLEIQNYRVTSIETGCFRNNIHLRTLNLGKNIISSLQADAFEGLGNLTFLNLNQNRLVDLKHSIFVHLSNLQELRLALNRFTYIGKNDFVGLKRLIKLDLRANYIFAIHLEAFKSVPGLRDLDLQHNKLTMIEAGVFKWLNSLQTIILVNNQITSLAPDSMRSNKLTLVNLIQNELSVIPKEFLLSVSSDKLDVYLARNKITEIKRDDLKGVSLKKLSLVSNWIWNIEPYAFNQTNISEIDLQQNQLITLSRTVHSYLNASHEILLGNNMWSCDCNIQWMAKFLKSHVTTSQPVCVMPDEYHGILMKDIADRLAQKCKLFDSLVTPFYQPPKQSLVTPELHTVPPTYAWITPQLRRTTLSTTAVKVSLTTPATTQNQTFSTNKQPTSTDNNKIPLIIAVCVSLIIVSCVIIGVIVCKVVRSRATVDTELSVPCRIPDINYRPRMSRISATWLDEIT